MNDGFDPILITFVKENIVTIGVVLYLLKGVARMTKWNHDDQIVSLLAGAFGMITKKKEPPPAKLPPVVGMDSGISGHGDH